MYVLPCIIFSYSYANYYFFGKESSYSLKLRLYFFIVMPEGLCKDKHEIVAVSIALATSKGLYLT